MTRYTGLFVFLALVAAAAYFGMTYEPGPFYAALQKPSWTPPNTWFAPVWTVLYVLMAVAAWRVWRKLGTNSIAIHFWAIARFSAVLTRGSGQSGLTVLLKPITLKVSP